MSGPFPASRLPEEIKTEIVTVIDDSKQQGIARSRSCILLQISVRRVERWRARVTTAGSMRYATPGPARSWNAILSEERAAVVEFVGREATVDLSLQALAIKGAESGLFFVSASSVRAIMSDAHVLSDRRALVRRHGSRVKPARPADLDGPNQCWCWDISYLATDIPRWFWFLYVMLDEWSRKVVAWRVGSSLAADEARCLCHEAVVAEGLLDAPPAGWPVVVNDRGVQMKAKPVQQMFKDLGIVQTFARPHTPNDNPFIESLFSTVKTAPEYPGRFPALDPKPVTDYNARFFTWYNNDHYHSRIGYVHPVDKHQGRASGILAQRKAQLTLQHQKRKLFWTSQNLTGGGL